MPITVLALAITGNNVFDIRSLTWDEWSYTEGVIFPIVTLGTIRPEDSGAARNARVSALNCTAKLKSPAVWACLGVDPLDMPRTPYRASEGKRSQ